MEFLLACSLSIFMTFVFRHIGIKFGFLDKPAGKLKPHETAIPYTGGTAMLLSLIPWLIHEPGYMVVVVSLWAIGFIDDVKGLNPSLRLMIELLAGFLFSLYYLNNSFFESLFLAFLFAAVVNAFNMIDGMDGVCSGVVVVSALVLVIVFQLHPLLLAFAGTFFGFFVWNFPPAKIFLGDQGSYIAGAFMGMMLLNSYGTESFIPVLAVVWLPLLDLSAGFLRRIIAGKSPFEGDRDHFYDKLFSLTKENKKATTILSIMMAFLWSVLGLLPNAIMSVSLLCLLSVVLVFKLKLLKQQSI